MRLLTGRSGMCVAIVRSTPPSLDAATTANKEPAANSMVSNQFVQDQLHMPSLVTHDAPELLESSSRFVEHKKTPTEDPNISRMLAVAKSKKESNANTIGSSVDPLCEQTTVTRPVSISLPPSPLNAKRVLFKDNIKAVGNDSPRNPDTLSGSTATCCGIDEAGAGKTPENLPITSSMDELRDKRYNSFKTWSGRLERQTF